MKEIVFQVLAEGGSLEILRLKTDENEKFVYHHNEFGLIDSDIISNEKSEYDSFQVPFLLIHSAYPWYQLHLTIVHKDYRDYVAEELIRLLNKFDMKWDLLAYSKKKFRKYFRYIYSFWSYSSKKWFAKHYSYSSDESERI